MTLPIPPPREERPNSPGVNLLEIRRGPWILTATILASSLAFIDGTVVNVALPALQRSLQATVTDIQWVVESYALLLSSLLLVGGSLGDRYGRRKVFLLGVCVFAIGSTACGLAPSITWLIVARGVQGIGAAFLIPGSLAILTASYAESERGRAIGTWSGFTTMTTAIGPVLGGWLVEHFSWHWVFLINLPIAVIVICLTMWRVPESRNENASRTLDMWGALLAVAGLGLVTFALIEAGRGGVAVGTGVVGLCTLIAFVIVEMRSAAPMISPRLFRSTDFNAANLLTFLLYAPLSGILFFLPLDLIQVQRYSPVQAGGALLPLILIVFVLSRWTGGLVARHGARLPLTVGPVVAAAGFALFLRPGIGGSYWTTFFPAVAILGIGLAVSVAPLTTTVMGSVSPSEAGVASGINNAVSRIAGLLAIALFGLILTLGFNRALDRNLSQLNLSPAERQSTDRQRSKLAGAQTTNPQVKEAINQSFLSGYRAVIWISVCMAIMSALSAQMIQSSPKR